MDALEAISSNPCIRENSYFCDGKELFEIYSPPNPVLWIHLSWGGTVLDGSPCLYVGLV